jgi:hypothetical protein
LCPGLDDPLDASLAGIDLRVKTTVATSLIRRFAKLLKMMVASWLPLALIRRIAGQDTPAGNDAAIYFIKPDLMSKLALFACFVATDDVCVRLETGATPGYHAPGIPSLHS